MCRHWYRPVSISMTYFNSMRLPALALAWMAALLTACGGGGESAPAIPALTNRINLTVDSGPADSGYNVNRLYADVTVCEPGGTQCQTIDHVLVDTGSTGLRLLSSAMAAGLNLSRVTGVSGFSLLSCVQFIDNTFAWGPVATADIVLGGKRASAVPIQIIADPGFVNPPSGCSVGGTAVSTAAMFGANGILGLGLFKEDCGPACASTTHNGFYYTCTTASCSATAGSKASLAQQVKNPVSLFATDNNGVMIDLPAVSATGAVSLSGSLVFGINTQANNQLGSAAVLTTDPMGDITTLFEGRSLTSSFLDTGSNGLYFDSSGIPGCVGNSIGFYCPQALTTLSATLVGANAATRPVSFSIDNAASMFANSSKTVLPTLSGTMDDLNMFDWGLPFFYGRRVFFGIEGQASTLGAGPFYAF